MSEVAEDKGIIDRFVGRTTHDDRIDVDTEISASEAVHLLWRCLLLKEVKTLFFAKFAMAAAMILPGLMLPWVSKIVIDNVLLQKPLGESDVPYPPFMMPIVNFLDGMAPLEIMFAITVSYFVAMVLIGARAGEGIYVELLGGRAYTGQDVTAQAENKISGGFSSAGGIWGIIEYWISGSRHDKRHGGDRWQYRRGTESRWHAAGVGAFCQTIPGVLLSGTRCFCYRHTAVRHRRSGSNGPFSLCCGSDY